MQRMRWDGLGGTGMEDKIIIKIIDTNKTEEIDVTEGFILLYTPDGCGVTEHGRVYDLEDRAAFVAAALLGLPEKDQEEVIKFVKESRQANSAAKPSKLVAIRGGNA